MLSVQQHEILRSRISEFTKINPGTFRLLPQGGGCFSETYKVVTGSGQDFFLKLNNSPHLSGLFEKETAGLFFLETRGQFPVPKVRDVGEIRGTEFLLLDWVEAGERNVTFWRKFGERLAFLHQVSSDRFGFSEDNFIGAMPQVNSLYPSWTRFFEYCRLRPQVEIALGNGLLQPHQALLFETVYSRLEEVFRPEPPSLVHGDLWSGNFLCDRDSSPLLIDPAIYFGHRSVDLAITTLFGGFDREFYAAYQYHFPLPAEAGEQWELCNLYPLLIHLNLFGTSYLPPILQSLKRFS